MNAFLLKIALVGRYCLCAAALLPIPCSVTAQGASPVVIRQNTGLNFIFVSERSEDVMTFDIHQSGTENYSIIKQYTVTEQGGGEQHALVLQSGAIDYIDLVQIGWINGAILIQQGPSGEPLYIPGTIYTREGFDGSYLANFQSGNVSISIFGAEGNTSDIGRAH